MLKIHVRFILYTFEIDEGASLWLRCLAHDEKVKGREFDSGRRIVPENKTLYSTFVYSDGKN